MGTYRACSRKEQRDTSETGRKSGISADRGGIEGGTGGEEEPEDYYFRSRTVWMLECPGTGLADG